MERELFTKEQILEVLRAYWGEKRVFLVPTKDHDLTTSPKGRNSQSSRSEWADKVVKKIYKSDRESLTEESLQFSYIKLAQSSDDGKVYGLVNGKSSIHHLYPGDVYFYSFDESTKINLRDFCKENNLNWYKDEIIFVRNKDDSDSSEAYKNERIMRILFNLFN